ncbi:MAG: hypothetical protein KatS3mg042_0048 [Rhodothermaceae bacterium]|nr:MAG: hypothetical protein KatS3mg042_0048 [Rhodothermaceae bacterium]
MRTGTRRVLLVGLILLGMLLPHAVWAQRYPFDVYSIDEGLAQSQPLSIYQSRNGYLWIGTLGGGVSRFDGRVFTNFGKRDGLPSGIVYGFAEDASGVLWVATGEGAARYDGRTFEPVELGLPPQRLLSAAVDGQGNVWFGTEASGVVRLGPSDTTRIADGLPDPKVLALLPDGEALWIGTTAGLCRYEGGALHCFSGDEGLPDTYVGELVRDAQGTLWAGTGKGLFRYAGDRFERVHPEVFEGHRISALAADRKGGIWVGTDQELIRIDGDDLVRYSRENGLIRPVLSLFEDEEGNLWIGLDGAGLARFAPSPFLLFTTEHGLAEDGAWSILEDRQGRIWLGTGNGLSRFDGQAFETFTTGDGLPGNTVYALFEDPDGTIWVGTEEGLARYDGARFHRDPGDRGVGVGPGPRSSKRGPVGRNRWAGAVSLPRKGRRTVYGGERPARHGHQRAAGDPGQHPVGGDTEGAGGLPRRPVCDLHDRGRPAAQRRGRPSARTRTGRSGWVRTGAGSPGSSRLIAPVAPRSPRSASKTACRTTTS